MPRSYPCVRGLEQKRMSKNTATKTAAPISEIEPPAQPPRDDGPSLTREEFCKLENISLSTYHKMKRNGTGPIELHYPGQSIVRITAQSRLDWQARREKQALSQAAKL